MYENSSTTLPPALEKVQPFPAVAAKLFGMFAKSDIDLVEVATLIKSDPTLTAVVLKAVNSYKYGVRSNVSSIRQAIGLIGLEKTKQITTTIAASSYVKRLATADLLRCWHHSVATAVLSEAIAKSGGAFENVAFVAGIMHDIGRLGLLAAYPDEYANLIRNAEKTSLDLLDAEEEKFGLNHAEAGRLLGEAWGLPEEFRVINGRHHDSCDGNEFDLLRIIHVACRLADALGFGVLQKEPVPASTILSELPTRVAARIEKTPEELIALIDERISTAT